MILELRGIDKRFGGVHALRNVDFAIDKGEVVALIGENGAGKSTLMRIVGGLQTPDKGQVFLDGSPANLHSVADAIKHGIAFIHQELNVLDNLDVAANVFLGREPTVGGFLRLIDARQMHMDAQRYLDRLGWTLPTTTSVNLLSIAQRQMVEIAKALSLNARILIMDEPTSSLTTTETERLLGVVKDLKHQGVSVVYISHRLGEVEEIADRAVALRDGANAGTLERSEITRDNMVRLMVGRNLGPASHSSNLQTEPDFFRVENLHTTRYPKQAISFSIGKGEILGLAGLMGAGRTEVAEALFGITSSTAARINLAGKALVINAPKDAISNGIYLIPEDRRAAGLIIEDPIGYNVTLPSLPRFASAGIIDNRKARAAAVEICAELNVKTASVDVKTANLSGGNQQKVVLAKWLSMNPRVLIFDEPTRGIDVGAKAEIYAMMRELADKGVAILMISSEMEEVLQVSDRVAVMHEGRLTGMLERKDCNEENIMRLAIGG